MAVYTNANNPQKFVIAGRNASGQIQVMATILVSLAVVGGKETATMTVTPQAGVTMTGVTPPATFAFS